MPEISEYRQVERPIKDVLKDSYLRIALARLRAKRLFRKYYRKKHPIDGASIFSYVAKVLSPILPDINPDKEYDIAVSYLTPHDYVLQHVRAKEKVAWIHTDYTQIDVNTELELPIWSGYDRIVSISSEVTNSFLKVFPTLSNKIEERPNVVSEKFVRARADEILPTDIEREMPRVPGRINLLSVGRFCAAKNYDNVPDICRRIREKGLDVHWYLIGFGGDEQLIKNKVAESGADGYVHILGKKDNPYPYMRDCDIYVQPSRYEGCPMTVLEADALGKKVILTDFPTAHNAIGRCSDGHIVPIDNEGCAKSICRIIDACF